MQTLSQRMQSQPPGRGGRILQSHISAQSSIFQPAFLGRAPFGGSRRLRNHIPVPLQSGLCILSELGHQPPWCRKCLLARKLVESGVRFVQLYHGSWDSHDYIQRAHGNLVAAVDQPIAALIKDLRERGRTAIVMAHRPSAIQACDVLLMLDRGQPRAYGPKEEVLRQTTSNHAQLSNTQRAQAAPRGAGG